MAELVFFRRGEEVLRFSLGEDRVVLGRGERCDVAIPDPEVSRQHVALLLEGNKCLLQDLSGKGTAVAGSKITQGEVADGADIALGQWRAVFRAHSTKDSADATEIGNRTELVAKADEADAPRLPAQIRVRHGAQESATRLQGDVFTIGKDAGNDVVLNHRFVSGRHVKVTRQHNRFQVVDQHSTNGTWLNGVRVFEAEVPFFTSLKVGDAEVSFEPLSAGPRSVGNYRGIIGNDPSMKSLAELIDRVAPSSAAVAIFGESGTGKELVARAVHDGSTRANGAFIPVNCAAISKELIESELFGHEKGAFTGAANARKGAFEEADGGTLFLDEIGELPLDLQAKLLRALESGEIKRVGASRPLNVDVRIVAATNRELLAAARDGKFREDLYYRLCVIPLHLPPLRNRRSDILPIAEHFVRAFSPRGQTVRLTDAALDALNNHTWPGNVRELRNVIHRALLLRKGPNVDVGDLSFDSHTDKATGLDLAEFQPGLTLEQMLQRAERQFVEAALRRFNNNRERVAKELGVARSTLFKRLKDWGLTHGNDEPMT
ncbi:MAG: sigma 54-interacting transcriptional regulator [Myxococcales bacterium]|nr:sigma 54-interacting transcriptional regulator [Myxococcales bacterium]